MRERAAALDGLAMHVRERAAVVVVHLVPTQGLCARAPPQCRWYCRLTRPATHITPHAPAYAGTRKSALAEPEQTAAAIDAAGWMHSGDLATLDSDGYANIVGRLKDMVVRGGENVYPREVSERRAAGR